MHRLGGIVAVVVVLSFASVPAFAALSPKYTDWAGPAQWVMTPQEAKAWKAVKTDEEASAFIDLFFARRDPTPGTPENEFRDEFNSRVDFADQTFAEGRKRGALTERGRFYIVVGAPTTMSSTAGYANRSGGQGGFGSTPQQTGARGGGGGGGGGGDFDPTGGRAMGARDIWTWEHDDAVKFKVPKIEAVFVQDPITRVWKRDTQRNDILAAFDHEKNTQVKNDLKALPDWAPHGGLEPKITVTVTSGGAPVVEKAPVTPEVPSYTGEPTATRLTLLKDVFSITSETKTDPFTTMTPVSVFTKQDELGWVAQYCTPSAEAPALKVALKISGDINGERINMNAPEDDITPDRIKASPGCWLVRGAVPVADMDAGTYTLKVTITDPATGKSYNLSQELKVQ